MSSSNPRLSIPTTPKLVKAKVRVHGTVKGKPRINKATLRMRSGVKLELAGKKFDGEYEYTPTRETQHIPIKGLVAKENITINPIPSNYGRIEFDGSALYVI